MEGVPVCCLLLLGFLCMANAEHGNVAVQYQTDEFKEEAAQTPHFMMFYAPWCGHCKRLAPTWDQLAEKFVNQKAEIVIGKVDCTVETKLCSEQGVSGYPTIKFFNKDDGERYKGGRDLDSLNDFVVEKLTGKKPEPVKEEAEDEKEEAVETGPLLELTAESFDDAIATGHTFVKFFAPWCGHCKRLAPVWEDLAKNMESNEAVSIAKIDCTIHREACTKNDVKGYPTLLYFQDGKSEKYQGGRDLASLEKFINKMLNPEPVEEVKESEVDKIPESTSEPTFEEQVMVLTTNSFKAGIREGATFVKFYAPWCGHCKRLAPTWVDLAARFKSNKKVNIAKVDCTTDRDVCTEFGVRGFPTLKLFENGAVKHDYSGARELQALINFVESKAPEHDEL